MLGVLQERYGYTKDEAQNEWDSFVSRYGNMDDSTQTTVRR
jgi:hypothetical protein